MFVPCRLLLLLLFFAVGYSAPAQDHYFKHYSADDGLNHNTVVTLLQDSRGFLWIGTKSGVSRFDGYSFKTYENEHDSLGALGNNVILCFAEDKAGMIWIGTERGLFKYDPCREKFTEAPFLKRSAFNNLLVDQQGDLWFLAGQILCRLDISTGRLQQTGIRAYCLALDAQGDLWMGTRNGFVQRLRKTDQRLESFRVIDQRLPHNMQTVSALLVTQTGQLLVGTMTEGFLTLNPATGQIKKILSRNTDGTEIYVRDMAAMSNDEYWLATETGIYLYQPSTGKVRQLQKRIGDEYALSDNAVYSLCRERSGGMWAGTFFGGLNFYSTQNAKIQKYYPLIDRNSISGNAVREIVSENQRELWIGTEDAGINKLDLTTMRFTHYTAQRSRTTLSYPNIHGLLPVGSKLYVGPFQHGLEIMDIRSGMITDKFRLFGDSGKQTSDFVMCIYRTRDNQLLLGSTGLGAGLFTYSPLTKTFTKCKQIPAHSYVYSILEDHAGVIWTGSLQRGAFFFDPRSGRNGNIRFSESWNGHPTVQGITEDSNHNLWFMTEGGGLIRLSADRTRITKYTVRNGLPSNYLFRALEDKQQNLWISSLKGLICFNTQTGAVRTFTRENGLLTDQFNYNSAYKDSSGYMYFGTVRGMIGFDPEEIIRPQAAPPLYITGLQINNQDAVPGAAASPLTRSIMLTDSLVLPYNKSNLSIEFAVLDYASPKAVRYRYRLGGLEKEWTSLKTNRKAYFSDLAPGDYVFTVYAESNVGLWRSTKRSLFIRVLPPFWKSTSAYVFYALALLAAGWLCMRYYKRRLEKKNLVRLQLFEHEKVKEIYQAKIEFFTNIAHEIQTPLTLIIGPVNLLKNKLEHLTDAKRNVAMIEKNTHRLYELTTQLLDFRKTEIDGFGLNFVSSDITALLKEQALAFQVQADAAGIELQIRLPRKHLHAFIDREAFTKIIGNLLSNAVKYAAGTATLELIPPAAGEPDFKVSISSDGPVIPTELHQKIFEPFFRIRGNTKQGTGIGLALAKSLAELHNGSLTLRTADGLNSFLLRLPVHQQFEFKLKT